MLAVEIFLFFPINSMSFTGEYGTDFIAGGFTQYALFCVTVSDSLFSTPTLMTQRRDATCEQVSPNPAMQLQCAATIFQVNYSQRLSEKPLTPWVVAMDDGKIKCIGAHFNVAGIIIAEDTAITCPITILLLLTAFTSTSLTHPLTKFW